MNKPFVSVILDNYNYGRFLGEAIESVLSQTYTNYELIIVDDGSTDHSREVIAHYCGQYPDKLVPVFKQNGGQASAFNAGFARAKGDIVAFLDSDDYWVSEKLAKVVALHESYAIVQHNLLKNENTYFNRLESGATIRHFLRQYGSYSYVMPTSALSFTHRLLQQVFPIPETDSLRICADSYIAGYALYLEEIYSLEECLGVYRVHGANHFCGADIDMERGGKIIEELNTALRAKGLLPLLPYFKTQTEALTAALIGETIIAPGVNYLVYGTGNLGLAFYDEILAKGGKVNGFSDSNPAKWGTFTRDKEVVCPENIRHIRHTFDKVVIGSMYVRDILEKLDELGYRPPQDVILPAFMHVK